MARDRTPIVKQSRREGFALHVKAHKYLIKKNSTPGQHGGSRFRRQRSSQYLVQLREKQKIKRMYGLMERQFRNLFKKAIRQTGPSGANALILLERRLDNAVYRAGFASSRRCARQLVNHKHFVFNGKRVNIPSLTLAIGDVIQIRPASKKKVYFKTIDDHSPHPDKTPQWLKVNRAKLSFEVISLPVREDIEEEVNEQLLIEYYSR